jgi:hypothetical protein
MTTKLDRTLKRELTISGEPYTLTISEDGFTLTLKGRRKGLDIRWVDLVGGDAALATALNASLTANILPREKASGKPPQPKPAREGPRRNATVTSLATRRNVVPKPAASRRKGAEPRRKAAAKIKRR